MLKKMLLTFVLVLQFAVAANVTRQPAPWPECFPCDDVPQFAAAASVTRQPAPWPECFPCDDVPQ